MRFLSLRCCRTALTQTVTSAGLSTALSRALSSRFHHLTSLPSVVICQAVCIAAPFLFILLTTTDSTCSRRQCRTLEALACCDIFELHYTPDPHRSWRASRCHPIRTGPATGDCRTGHCPSRVCRAALHWEHFRIQEAMEGHSCKY